MELKLIDKLPELKPNAVEDAVKQFIKDSHSDKQHVDTEGYFQQTLEMIAQALVWGQPGGHFWLAEDGGEVAAYALCQVFKSIDNRMTYWMNQAWVSPKHRHTPFVRECYEKLRAEAKKQNCAHIIVPSSRGTKGYLRFLGKQWHVYASLLKEDI